MQEVNISQDLETHAVDVMHSKVMAEQTDKLIVLGIRFSSVRYIGSHVDVPLTYNLTPRYDHWLLRTEVASRPDQKIWVYRDICDPRGVFRAIVRKTLEGTLEFEANTRGESQIDFVYNRTLYSCRLGRSAKGSFEYSMIKETEDGQVVDVPGMELQAIQNRVQLLSEVSQDRPWCKNPGVPSVNADKVFAQSIGTSMGDNSIGFYLNDLCLEDAFFHKIEYASVDVRYNLSKV